MDTGVVNAIVGVTVPLYVIGIVIPSIAINGLIVAVFVKNKELRTPANILAVHIAVIGLLVSLFSSTVKIPDFILSMTACNCALTYYNWIFALAFHFSLYPLSVLALAVSNFLILNLTSTVVFTQSVSV